MAPHFYNLNMITIKKIIERRIATGNHLWLYYWRAANDVAGCQAWR